MGSDPESSFLDAPDVDDDEPTLPTWIFNPRSKILGIVATWIVGGVLTAWTEVLGIVLQAGEVLIGIPGILVESLGVGFGSISGAILGVLGELNAALVETALSAGPFGWLVLAVSYVAIVFGLLRAAAFVLDLIDVPGIDLGTLARGLFSPVTRVWRWLT